MIYIPRKIIKRQAIVVLVLSFLIALLVYTGGDWRVEGQIKEPEQVEAISAFAPHRIIKNAVVYAYTSRVEETDGDLFTTASGEKVRTGIVANNCLEFGTKVDINGFVYEVKDRMNRRYTDCDGQWYFDIWMDDLAEARKWGKKTTDILVYVPQD